MSEFQVGDTVRVRKPASVMHGPGWSPGMEVFDGSLHRIKELLADGGNFKLVGAGDYKFHPDWLEPVEPIRSWVPEGYSVVEIAVPDAMEQAIGDGNALVWKKPAKGEDYIDISIEFCPVIVPTTPPAEQYREPTSADVGKMVEVSDFQAKWFKYELLAVLPQDISKRFIVRGKAGDDSYSWKYARIKNEEVK